MYQKCCFLDFEVDKEKLNLQTIPNMHRLVDTVDLN